MTPRIQSFDQFDEAIVAADLAARWGAEDGAAGVMAAIPLLSPQSHAAYLESFWSALRAAQQMRAHVARRCNFSV